MSPGAVTFSAPLGRRLVLESSQLSAVKVLPLPASHPHPPHVHIQVHGHGHSYPHLLPPSPIPNTAPRLLLPHHLAAQSSPAQHSPAQQTGLPAEVLSDHRGIHLPPCSLPPAAPSSLPARPLHTPPTPWALPPSSPSSRPGASLPPVLPLPCHRLLRRAPTPTPPLLQSSPTRVHKAPVGQKVVPPQASAELLPQWPVPHLCAHAVPGHPGLLSPLPSTRGAIVCSS